MSNNNFFKNFMTQEEREKYLNNLRALGYGRGHRHQNPATNNTLPQPQHQQHQRQMALHGHANLTASASSSYGSPSRNPYAVGPNPFTGAMTGRGGASAAATASCCAYGHGTTTPNRFVGQELGPVGINPNSSITYKPTLVSVNITVNQCNYPVHDQFFNPGYTNNSRMASNPSRSSSLRSMMRGIKLAPLFSSLQASTTENTGAALPSNPPVGETSLGPAPLDVGSRTTGIRSLTNEEPSDAATAASPPAEERPEADIDLNRVAADPKRPDIDLNREPELP